MISQIIENTKNEVVDEPNFTSEARILSDVYRCFQLRINELSSLDTLGRNERNSLMNMITAIDTTNELRLAGKSNPYMVLYHRIRKNVGGLQLDLPSGRSNLILRYIHYWAEKTGCTLSEANNMSASRELLTLPNWINFLHGTLLDLPSTFITPYCSIPHFNSSQIIVIADLLVEFRNANYDISNFIFIVSRKLSQYNIGSTADLCSSMESSVFQNYYNEDFPDTLSLIDEIDSVLIRSLLKITIAGYNLQKSYDLIIQNAEVRLKSPEQ